MPLRQAVDAPRCHHAWMPNELEMEAALRDEHKATLDQLRSMGHTFAARPAKQGDAHSIRIDPGAGRLEGVADQRRDGWAAGY